MPIARHILTYAQSLRGGGVERAQLRLAGAWLAAGRRVTLVLGDARGPLAAELPAGLDLITLGSIAYRDLLVAVPRDVRDLSPDAIFCPGNHYTGIAAWTKLRRGAACPPTIAKVSNALVRADQGAVARAGYRWWLRRHPRFVDRFVALSPAMAVETIALTGIAAERVSVIPNPPARPIPGAPIPALPAGRFVLGVGRLVPQKRWERLIEAFARIADPLVSLVILGEGPERAALAARIAVLGIANRLFLPGHAADPLPVIARAAVLALVSDFEGAPGVLHEALGCGTPVIATDASVAVREIVSSDALGSVVAAGDAAALVAALDHWLAPGRARPAPVPPPGEDSAVRYLDLFDRLVSRA